jgi:4-hydroxybenzoate polyprenyltransferase
MHKMDAPQFHKNPACTGWLRLLRLPNLLTVPGDVLAGYVLAAGGPCPATAGLVLAVAAGLCLYAAGLLINDLVDLEPDRRQRPDRPLPSGVVPVRVVRLVAVKLVALGLLLSVFAGTHTLPVAASLAAAILLYNLKTKRVAVWGPVTMGLCRGLNVLLGVMVQGHVSLSSPAFLGAGVILLYITALTHAARHEAGIHAQGVAAWLPFGVGLVGLAAVAALAQPGTVQARTGFIVAALLALGPALTFARKPSLRGPGGIGMMIGALLLIQAALCMAFGATSIGVVLLLLWPLFRLLARAYPSS